MKDYMDEADALIREYECDHPLPERLIAAALRAARDDGLEEATTRIRELEAEIERLRAAQQWRPIEEAPRDGTEVLVWAGLNPPEKWHESLHDIRPYIGPASYHPDAGWCVCTVREVTHWMPRPADPEPPTPPEEGK